MRPLEIKSFFDEKEFTNKCIDTFSILLYDFDYHYNDMCHEIKDLDKVLKKKKDWYRKVITVYYIQDECYFVAYRKHDIWINVLNECKGCSVAHGLAKKFTEIHNKKKELEEIEFDELVRETMPKN